ncbi:MAG: purine-binding chemotaxis protein CheW [Moorea sp. SIO2B7]|nr:purine-binding chemotaxis protein CheW [Moorena sp. SIO2B7]
MNTSTLELQSSQSQRNLGDPYLRLQLNEQTAAALPMEQSEKVIFVPVSRITPIPNMPNCVLGLLNQSNRVFWVVDLAHMLDLKPLDTDAQKYNIVIVRVGTIPLGLVVRDVKGVIRVIEDSIQSPIGTVAPSLVPYLQGCLFQKKGVLLILDTPAIVNSSILH